MKNKDFDLAAEMSKYLHASATEEQTHAGKIALATQHLNQAAEILEEMHAGQASEIIVKILERTAKVLEHPAHKSNFKK